MTIALSGTHRIGKPVFLNEGQIRERRAMIESEYGSERSLKNKRRRGILKWDEAQALRDLENLDFLAGN